MTDTWELRHDHILIGKLTITDQDMFWYTATFEPTPSFAAYRAIFEEGNNLRVRDAGDAWTIWYEKVQSFGLRLVRLSDQASASEFILYIDGSDADFRPHFDS
jgi:hypothetical protein